MAVRELQEVPSQKRETANEQVGIKIHSTGESGKNDLMYKPKTQ